MLTVKGGQEPGRNELCPCKSGLKFKWCHGDPAKKAVCEIQVRETMLRLIMQEKFKRDMITEEELNRVINRIGDEDEEESRILQP